VNGELDQFVPLVVAVHRDLPSECRV